MPPPFPVVAPPKTGKTAPSIPHISVKNEPSESEKLPPPLEVKAVTKKKRLVMAVAAIAAVFVVGGLVFAAYKMFIAPAPPPPPAAKAKVPVPAAPKTPTAATPAPAPAAVSKPAAPAPLPAAAAPATPSATLNALAHAPVNAINKAQGAIETRRASGQTNIGAALTEQELADKPAVAATTATEPKTSASKPPTARTSITRGVSATTDLEVAAVEASPEFRSFVANAKVSGVFQGSPARAFINGRMARTGDTVEPTLGIIFDGVEPVKRHLLFKDKSGAVVARKY
jgi:hypothetical protein